MASDPHSAEYFAQVLKANPMGGLSTQEKKAQFDSQPSLLKSTVDGFAGGSAESSLAVLYDLLRSDASCFSMFESRLSEIDFYKKSMAAISGAKNEFAADKAAWLLSGVIGNVPKGFSQADVRSFLDAVKSANCSCSEQGKLDAVVNVLKANEFRQLAAHSVDLDFNTQTAAPAIVYKKMFSLWLLSFDGGALPFKEEAIALKFKEVLTYSRVEKVVRLSLTCLQSLLSNKDVADEVVEQGLLQVVQALEFEKWRDAELYDDIRSMSAAISTRVAELSNFSRYERELSAGKLKWGFIHSPKFWSENVLKFEQNDWRALHALRKCLDLAGDSTTVAVACHDLGEFVTAHPLGKKQVTALGVKDKVMQLMSSSTSDKEVKREALLCCQKIMLNKWQDIDASA